MCGIRGLKICFGFCAVSTLQGVDCFAWFVLVCDTCPQDVG